MSFSADLPPAGPAAPAPVVQVLSPAQMFDLADRSRDAGNADRAIQIYKALSVDRKREIRAEAHFRLGQLFAAENRLDDAAIEYRAVLDEQPQAGRVRIELAALLARMGRAAAARRELRQARAGTLPPAVANLVQQMATVLDANKPAGGSLAIAFAPDTNVNRATRAKIVDSVIAPLTLSSDARARSGIGLFVSGQAFGQIRLAKSVTFVPRVSGDATLYRDGDFNDISGSLQAAIRIGDGADRVTLSGGPGRRDYGGHPYTRTLTVGGEWQHDVARSELRIGATASTARYSQSPLQDGHVYAASGQYERALGSRSSVSASASVSRQTARNPAYANWSFGPSILITRQHGQATYFLSTSVRRLESDGSFFLFDSKRREWFGRLELGAALRRFRIARLAPLIRVAYERNWSSLDLYAYRRLSTSIGFTSAF